MTNNKGIKKDSSKRLKKFRHSNHKNYNSKHKNSKNKNIKTNNKKKELKKQSKNHKGGGGPYNLGKFESSTKIKPFPKPPCTIM